MEDCPFKTYCNILRLEGDLLERNQWRISSEQHWVQMDQQLQEGLFLSWKICTDAEDWARSSNLIGQKSGTEIPELLWLDAFQELV